MDITTTRFPRTARGVATALLAATLLVATSGGARSAEPAGEGTSQVSITPAALGVDLALVDELDATLGRLLLEATTVGTPAARLAFEGLGAGGQGAAPLALSSADGDKQGSEGRAAAAAGFSAVIGLVDYAIEAGDDHASARLGALRGSLDTPLGLAAQLDAQQVASTVTSTGAGSDLRLTISGLELGLGDLLPADVLAELPLSVVLDLVDGLGVTVPADLAAVVADVEVLVPVLEATAAAISDLDEAEAELAAIIAGDPSLAALQDAVDVAELAVADAEQAVVNAEQAVADAELAVAALEAEVASIEQTIADLEAERLDLTTSPQRLLEIPGEILALQAQLAETQADLEDAGDLLVAAEQLLVEAAANLLQAQQDLEAAVADLVAALEAIAAVLVAEIERLQQIVDDLLAELAELLTGLDLVGLRLDLLDLLLGTPLLDLGAMTLHLSTEAGPISSLGEAACTVGETRVLGMVVPTPDCAAIGAALAQVSDAIATALAALPITVPLPAVTASGPSLVSSGAGGLDAAGSTTATATFSPLRVGVASVDLTGMVDGLVTEVEALVGELIGDTESLAAAQLMASAVTLSPEVDALLAELAASLEALPVGDTLDGLSTNGLDATLATVGLSSTFTAQQAGPPGGGGDPDGGDPTSGSPGDGSGGTPGDGATSGGGSSDGSARGGGAPGLAGNLPRTGLEVHGVLAAAVAALLAGGVALGVRRELAVG